MSKILNTQLTGIFNRIEKQAMEIQMAAQCIVQAIGGEGFVYIKGYEDLAFFEPFILQSQERLRSSRQLSTLNSFDDLDTTDRVFLFSPFYNEAVAQDISALLQRDIDIVLVSNRPKSDDFPEHLLHFINLSTPRPIVYTEDYDKIVQPHSMAFNYIYYDIYTQMVEMTRDLEL
ncbi:DUF2529 domain-containing protein [Staphylococcus lugdunensis]|jgi:hypothetical protein|uniref:DUF2529 domain-containing protein n=2 Tax=Staphylococcus TaxID=1279 RepID=A0A133QBK8_STALU|nr:MULTISPECIES: DUF2529 family protein [Staphylococcus]ADC87036.1 Hypothetical protein SLGD_00898 [Staphylococcus lugdunensis HKU09-01]AMG62451.1 hypothetical protein AL499_10975 [Staphylococcus lugdunensis]AMG63625.1 DUF2529 domain-containing protein [Staphylococcus lugdunensis]ARB77307.1 DUF2529 domain-containing protein [Staphylococcus lugdunensis]ARJ08818.1 hypothetical protein B7454_05245 [Staphylococcus lugdunensis]